MGNWFRSSHRRCSIKKVVFLNFTNFPGKHLSQSLFFNKAADLRPETLLKKRLWHKCFHVNFAPFLRTPFLQNTSRRLLLLNGVKFLSREGNKRIARVNVNNNSMFHGIDHTSTRATFATLRLIWVLGSHYGM